MHRATTPRTSKDGRRAPSVRARTVRELSRTIRACDLCQLNGPRRRPVLGQGPEDAGIVVVAGVPGRQEDLQGLPLAGGARNVLDHALAAAGVDQDLVRITAVVRCRPEDGQGPTSAQVAACAHHLDVELELVAPKVIVTLGVLPTAVVLGRPVQLERVAGYRLDVRDGVTLVPTYDPADVVRGLDMRARALQRHLTVARAVLDGRMKTGAEALADLRARL